MATMTKIEETVVPANKASLFLPTHFGHLYLQAERFMFAFSTRHLQGYDGGLWDYVTLSNGGFYMRPLYDGKKHFTYAENYAEEELTAKEYGLVCTIFTITMCFSRCGNNQTRLRYFAKKRDDIMDYICSLPSESSKKILRAID